MKKVIHKWTWILLAIFNEPVLYWPASNTCSNSQQACWDFAQFKLRDGYRNSAKLQPIDHLHGRASSLVNTCRFHGHENMNAHCVHSIRLLHRNNRKRHLFTYWSRLPNFQKGFGNGTECLGIQAPGYTGLYSNPAKKESDIMKHNSVLVSLCGRPSHWV